MLGKDNPLFSCDWNTTFYRLDPCPKCSANTWKKDWIFSKRSRHRDRYSCFVCGYDQFTGTPAALSYTSWPTPGDEPGIGALDIIPEPRNTTSDG